MTALTEPVRSALTAGQLAHLGAGQRKLWNSHRWTPSR